MDASNSLCFRVSVAIILGLSLAIGILEAMLATPIYPVFQFGRGGDFTLFFQAAVRIQNGGSLYAGDFIKPPLYALILTPLAHLPFVTALTIYQMALTVTVAAALWAACRAYQQSFWPTVAVIGITLSSWSFVFLIDRGNVDGLSIGLGIIAAVLASRGMNSLPMLLIGLAVNIKTSALPLLAAIAVRGSIKRSLFYLFGLVFSCFVVAALTPEWNLDWLSIARRRTEWRSGQSENISAFLPLARLTWGRSVTWAFLAGSLLSIGCATLRKISSSPQSVRTPSLFPLVLPFCYAYPPMSYGYAMVFSPLLLIFYGSRSQFEGRGQTLYRLACWIGCLGVVAGCFPLIPLIKKFSFSNHLFIIPSIGVCTTIFSNAVLAWQPMGTDPVAPSVQSTAARLGERAGQCGLILCTTGAVYALISYFVFGYSRVLWLPEPPRLAKTAISIVSHRQQWGTQKVGFSVVGTPLSVGGKIFRTGFGTHSAATTVVQLPPNSRLLRGACAVDDSSQGRAEGFQCVVLINGKEVFRSPTLKGKMPLQPFEVATHGATTASLIVESTTAKISWNHADWLDLDAE